MLQSRPSSCKPVYIAGKAFLVANPLRQEAGGKATPRDSLPLGLFCCYGYTWVHGYTATPVDGDTHMGIHCRQGLLGRAKATPGTVCHGLPPPPLPSSYPGFWRDCTKGCSMEQLPLFALVSVCFKRQGCRQGLC